MTTKGNVVQTDLIHSRIMIIDDSEALISSADLTREQLVDEFNAFPLSFHQVFLVFTSARYALAIKRTQRTELRKTILSDIFFNV